MLTVYGLLDARFGGPTELVTNPEGITTAGTTDQIYLRQDPRRVAFTLTNTSANTIYVQPASPASTTSAILVTAGGILSVAYPDDLHLASMEWHVYAATASTFATYALMFQAVIGEVPTGMGAF